MLRLVTQSLRWLEYSVEGNPPYHEPALQAKARPLRLLGGLTLYVDMGWPIALNVRRHPLTSSVQGGIILVTDSGCGSIVVMEDVR